MSTLRTRKNISEAFCSARFWIQASIYQPKQYLTENDVEMLLSCLNWVLYLFIMTSGIIRENLFVSYSLELMMRICLSELHDYLYNTTSEGEQGLELPDSISKRPLNFPWQYGHVKSLHSIDPFSKRHRLVHWQISKFEALYCGLNVVSSTEIS